MTKSGWAWALVIDDDAEVRTYVSATLARIGVHAVQAASGAEGLAKLSERHYDVVLLDNDMPGMRGVEACLRGEGRQIRSGGRCGSWAVLGLKDCALAAAVALAELLFIRE